MDMSSNNSTILTTTLSPQGGAGPHKIVSDYTTEVMQWTFYVVLCGSISFIGLGTNVTNMIVFIKTGLLSDSNTISLFYLAIIDICSLLSLIWLSICFIIAMEPPSGINFDPWSVLFLTAGRPHVVFTQAMCVITAYIAFERCISVAFPFKVKSIFTAKRTMVFVPCLVVGVLLLFTPVLSGQYLGWISIPGSNSSLLVVINDDNLDLAGTTFFNYLNVIGLRFFFIISVMVLNAAISAKVLASKKWRKTAGSSGKSESKDDNDTKERRLVRMITTICTIFSVCYTPDIILSSWTMIDNNFYNKRPQHNLFHVMYSIAFLMEAVNSTVNILVYYKMSTRYRQTFRRLFHMKERSATQ